MKPVTLVALVLTSSAIADLRVRSSMTAGGQTTETITYTKGQRQRIEYGKEFALIQQCDRKRTLQVDPAGKTFMVLGVIPAAPVTQPSAQAPEVVNIRTTVNDTGETKPWFGQTARRVKSTIVKTGGTCQQGNQTTEVDGWYIDFQAPVPGCSLQSEAGAGGGCQDKVQSETAGNGKLGYPVAYTMATTSGGKTDSITMEVLELDKSDLAAALFEEPTDFQDAAARKPGLKRVALVPVQDKTGQSGGWLTQKLQGKLAESGVDAVMVPAGSAADTDQKAKQQQADYILYADLAQLGKPETKSSGGKRFGGFVARASGMLNQKEAWEAKIDYRLMAVGSPAPLVSATAIGKTGGDSFNVAGAVNLATNVTMMMTMGPMMGSGFMKGGLMNTMMGMNGMGGAGMMGGGLLGGGMLGGGMAGGGLMGGGMMVDSGMMGLQAIAQQQMAMSGMGAMGGMNAPTSAEAGKAVDAAIGDMLKALTAQWKK